VRPARLSLLATSEIDFTNFVGWKYVRSQQGAITIGIERLLGAGLSKLFLPPHVISDGDDVIIGRKARKLQLGQTGCSGAHVRYRPVAFASRALAEQSGVDLDGIEQFTRPIATDLHRSVA